MMLQDKNCQTREIFQRLEIAQSLVRMCECCFSNEEKTLTKEQRKMLATLREISSRVLNLKEIN